jgi:hypothetical protein
VAVRRAVVRPPFLAAARRVVVRRAVVRPPFLAAARRVVVLRRAVLRVPVVARRRVPPVERERAVVLRERDAVFRVPVDDFRADFRAVFRVPVDDFRADFRAVFRVPVERDRLVVVRLRPRLDAARTREMVSSSCLGCSSGCC